MAFIFYLISPLLSLPFILLDVKNRKKGAILLFAIFLGTFAYCTIPLQDLFRHLANYENYSTYKISDFSYFDFEMNGIVVYLYSIMGHLNIPFDILRFITTALGFYLLSNVFEWKINNSQRRYSKKSYFLHFLILTFYFDITYTIAGVRYGVALCFYIYGSHLILERNSTIRGLLWIISAMLYHPSFLFLTLASYTLYFLKINKRTIIIFSLFAFICMSFLFSHYSYLLGNRADWYINSTEGSSSYKAMTIYGFLGFVLPKLCGIPIVILLLKFYNSQSIWMRLSLSWFVLSIICLNNAVFFYRVWWGFMATGVYVLIDYEVLKGIDLKYVKIFLTSSILFSILSLIPVKNFIIRSKYERLLLPTPLIINEHYTTSDILKQYPTAGDFVNE